MTPEIEQLLRRWYGGQLIVLGLATFVRLFITADGSYFPVVGMILLIWGLFAWWPLAEDDQWWRLRHINYYVQTILQLTILPALLANLIALFSQYAGLNEQGLIAVGMTYSIVMFVPVAYVVVAPIGSLIGRIVMLAMAVFSGAVGAQATLLALPILKAPAVFEMVSNAAILGAIGFVITVYVLMRTWGIAGPTWRFSKNAKPGLIGVLLVIGVLFSLWNAFSAGGSWATTFTSWDFHLQSATWKMFLSGLEPGIAEEWLYRFAVLTLLLVAFKQRVHQIDWAIWLSGALFGLWHITNAMAQPWSATIEQMIFAMTLGWFLATVYLYSGSIVAAMAIHAVIDILSMMASGSQTMAKPNAFEWQTMGLIVVVFAAITLYFSTGKRRQVMQRNIDERLLK